MQLSATTLIVGVSVLLCTAVFLGRVCLKRIKINKKKQRIYSLFCYLTGVYFTGEKNSETWLVFETLSMRLNPTMFATIDEDSLSVTLRPRWTDGRASFKVVALGDVYQISTVGALVSRRAEFYFHQKDEMLKWIRSYREEEKKLSNVIS